MDEQLHPHQPVNFLEPKNQNLHQIKPPRRRFWRTVIFAAVVLVLICGTNYFLSSQAPNTAEYDPITLKPKNVDLFQTVKNFIFHSNNVLAGQSDDRINILLLGIGGPGHDGPFLSDTNIILSIKPSTKQIAMVSVPRDLGVKLDNGIYKINSASAFGETKNPGQGGEYAREVFAKNFALDIPYYIRVDFKAFEDLINAVGGIAIDVPRAFNDNLFPGPNETYNPISFTAGLQTMSGERALQYARSRHGNNGEGSDFARARRQQQVLTALKQKLLSFGTYTNPATIQQMLDTLSAHVSTNLNFGQIMFLASLARESSGDIKTLVLDNSPDGFLYSYIADSGAFLLGPKTGNFNQINEAIKYIFDTDHPVVAEKTTAIVPAQANQSVFPGAKIEIQNGTWHAGLAARYKAKLEGKGFTIYSTGNSVRRPIDKTGIYLVNQAAPNEIVKGLSDELKVAIATTLPDWLGEEFDDPNTSSTEAGLKFKPESDILIILGEDANI